MKTDYNNYDNVKDEKRAIERLKKYMKFKYLQISLYVIFTVIVIFLLISIMRNSGNILSVVGKTVDWFSIITKPIAFGFIIAYLLFPLVNFFEKKLDKLKDKIHHVKPFKNKKKRSSRNLAVTLTWFIVILLIFILTSLIVSTVAKEVTTVKIKDIDMAADRAEKTINSFADTINNALEKLNVPSVKVNDIIDSAGKKAVSIVKDFGTGIVKNLKNVTGFFTTLLFSIIFAVYFMADGEELKKYWGRVIRAFCTPKGYERVKGFVRDVDTVFSGYIRGQLIDAFIMMVSVSLVLSLLDIKYSVFIGVMTGIGNVIPYAGPFVAYVLTTSICLIQGDMNKLVLSVVAMFIIQTIDGNVVNPRLLGTKIHIHPLLVIISLLIGGAIGGIAGMILAVPCGALIKRYFERFVDFRIKKSYGEKE